MYYRTWDEVIAELANERFSWRHRLRVEKGVLPHPLRAGMSVSVGLPEGQNADYRRVLANGTGFHVKDFGGYYEAHLDEVHPHVDFAEHLRQDAPHIYVRGAAAMGAAVGGMLSKSWQGALAGALLAGIIGAALADEATQDDNTRARP